MYDFKDYETWEREKAGKLERWKDRQENPLWTEIQDMRRLLEMAHERITELERIFHRAHAITVTEVSMALGDEKVVHICSRCGAIIPMDKVENTIDKGKCATGK